MSSKSTSALTLVEAIPLPALDPNPKQARLAIKRCCAAWKRAYDAYMEGKDGSEITMVFAAHDAGPAFCKAMPLLPVMKTSATSSLAWRTAYSSTRFPKRGPTASFTRRGLRSPLTVSI